MKVVVLDSGPLWLLAAPPGAGFAAPCHRWAASLAAAGHRLVVPEITDYEVRRELTRRRHAGRVGRLNRLAWSHQYASLDTPTMRRAADLWADARQQGLPTAGDKTIDADVILVAQAELLQLPNTVIASTNLRHLRQFGMAADLWTNITP